MRCLVLSALLAASASALYSCLNDQGSPVDWWVALKVNNDYKYYYLDSTGKTPSLRASKSTLDGSSGAIVQTIKQIYDKLPSEHGYVLYNDETDDSKGNTGRAHAKGALLFDDKQGFWLIHSVPRFPRRRSAGYEVMPSATYGQSFICATFGIEQFEEITNSLALMAPLVYDSSMSKAMATHMPSLASLTTNSIAKFEIPSVELSLTTAGGAAVTHFSKSKNYDGDFYEDLLAPSLKASLFVETWMNGDAKNRMPSSYKDPPNYSVIHVDKVTMADSRSEWVNSQDHSKWAVTTTSGTVCIGDLNRQYSQGLRGGGALCIKNAKLWGAFNAIINPAKTTTNLFEDKNDSNGPISTVAIVCIACACTLAVALIGFVLVRRSRAGARNDNVYVLHTPSQPVCAVTPKVTEP
eukprot:c25949_g1_i1.p1 GENE.c25949_g1_i1~~c25949_g1_i1.p1  ORF type:complete len:409 (-),score=82.41 c25949_g1_i1:34-1260(-)